MYLAENVACHGVSSISYHALGPLILQDCCVYHTDHNGGARDTFDLARSERSRLNAQTLLGCGDTGKNKINVMGKFDWTYLYISNGDGCGGKARGLH
jgi:hypothetical protein